MSTHISKDVVILTKAELQELLLTEYLQGERRGRFELAFAQREIDAKVEARIGEWRERAELLTWCLTRKADYSESNWDKAFDDWNEEGSFDDFLMAQFRAAKESA